MYILLCCMCFFKASITAKCGNFCRLLECISSVLSNSVDPDQTAPVGSTQFAAY